MKLNANPFFLYIYLTYDKDLSDIIKVVVVVVKKGVFICAIRFNSFFFKNFNF
jgi:hypothetical protein